LKALHEHARFLKTTAITDDPLNSDYKQALPIQITATYIDKRPPAEFDRNP